MDKEFGLKLGVVAKLISKKYSYNPYTLFNRVDVFVFPSTSVNVVVFVKSTSKKYKYKLSIRVVKYSLVCT